MKIFFVFIKIGSKDIVSFMLLAFVMLVNVSNVFSEDIRVGKTSMKVSSGGSVVVKNDLSVDADALIWNEGSVYLNNEHETCLSLGTILDGSGVYYINGIADCIIEGDGAAVSSLYVESGNTVYIRKDFFISGILTLGSGVIEVEEGVFLKILDTSPDAIVSDDSPDNTSFIDGSLVRKTVSGNEYLFPLGTASSGFHPFKADEISSSGYLGVSYSADYDDIWNSGDHNGGLLEDIGGWQVSTDSEGITFKPYLSLYSTDGLLDGSYNLFYTSEPDGSPLDFSLDYNSGKSNEGSYLTSETAYAAGLFAAGKIETVTSKEGEKVPELVNYLARNGTGRTTFEIPGIEDYKEVILSVYDRFGNKVYESSNYANDFDVRNYRSGTYFYELTLIKDERKVLFHNIIEVVEYK